MHHKYSKTTNLVIGFMLTATSFFVTTFILQPNVTVAHPYSQRTIYGDLDLRPHKVPNEDDSNAPAVVQTILHIQDDDIRLRLAPEDVREVCHSVPTARVKARVDVMPGGPNEPLTVVRLQTRCNGDWQKIPIKRAGVTVASTGPFARATPAYPTDSEALLHN